MGSSRKIRFGGIDVSTGFTSDLIDRILDKSEYVSDLNYLNDNLEFWHKEHAIDVFQIIERYTAKT